MRRSGLYSVNTLEVLHLPFSQCSLTFLLFQLLSDVTTEEEVEILTGLGQTLLTLGDITQATQASILCASELKSSMKT